MSSEDDLRAALRALLHRGQELAVPPEPTRHLGGVPTQRHVAETLAGTAEAEPVNELAHACAMANGYGVRTDHAGVVSAGRSLDEDAIVGTGLAAWLLDSGGTRIQPVAIIDEVVEALSAFLAGPPVPIARYVGIDADVVLSGGPVDVGGWELVVADRDLIRGIQPVPPLLDFAPAKTWDPEMWHGATFLRRIEPDASPAFGLRLYLQGAFPELAFWAPLLVLSCFKNEVVTVWSDHVVEPGRHVGTRLDRVWYDTIGGEDWTVDRPMSASLGIEPPGEDMFRRFCAEFGAALDLGDSTSQRAKVLRRSAERFLRAAEHSYVRPDSVDPARQPDAIAAYVACLESLVAPDGSAGEVARKVEQRTAVLVGSDDGARLGVADETRRAYRARSSWAHGDDIRERDRPDIAALRDTVRRVLIAWVAITRAGTAPGEFGAACDRALLSAMARDDLLRPVADLRARVSQPADAGEDATP